MRSAFARALATASLLIVSSGYVAAEEGKPAESSSTQPLSVSPEKGLYLIRTTLLTLNDANRSGNYSVLRDLAAPGFQAANTAADLAEKFSDLRHRNFDLFSAALAVPQLTNVPAIDRNMLRLTGFFPTVPLRINFDLLFENVGDQWRVFGISIATVPAPTEPTQTASPSPSASNQKKPTTPQRKTPAAK